MQEPVEREGGHTREGKRYTHPAFGMIGASRVIGGTTLFGTDFIHQNYITLTIRSADLVRDLAHDWPSPGNAHVEVALSEAQWATLVSSLNVGMGVQCTIERLNGKQMPGIPLRRENEVHQDETRKRIAELANQVTAAIQMVEGELAPALSQKKRDAVLGHLRKLHQDIKSNIPWYAEVMEEKMHTLVESAKIEVNAYVTSTIQRAGLSAIAQGDKPVLSLADGSEPPPP